MKARLDVDLHAVDCETQVVMVLPPIAWLPVPRFLDLVDFAVVLADETVKDFLESLNRNAFESCSQTLGSVLFKFYGSVDLPVSQRLFVTSQDRKVGECGQRLLPGSSIK